MDSKEDGCQIRTGKHNTRQKPKFSLQSDMRFAGKYESVDNSFRM